jgi:hypothetical protein
MNAPSLYRAVYQSADARLRGMTFAAPTAEAARQVAEGWQANDKLLTLQALRELPPPLFTLL